MFLQHDSLTVRGLYQDICQNPLDDTPRLILADWLEENGDAWEQGFAREWLRPQLQKSRNKRTEWRDRPEQKWFHKNRFGLEQRLGKEVLLRVRGRFVVKASMNGYVFFYGFRRGFPAALEWQYDPLRVGAQIIPKAIRGLPIEYVGVTLSRSILNGTYALNCPWEDATLFGLEKLRGEVVSSGVPKRLRAISGQILAWAREQNRKEGLW